MITLVALFLGGLGTMMRPDPPISVAPPADVSLIITEGNSFITTQAGDDLEIES